MKKLYGIRIGMFLLLFLLALVSLAVGVKEIDFLHLTQEDFSLIFLSRVPRLLAILVVGGSMSITGLIMQTITKNNFVSPSTIGTVEWTRLGILTAIMFFPGAKPMLRMSVAFVFGFLGSMIFIRLLTTLKVKNDIMVPLIGIMLGNVVSSVATFFAYQYDLLQNMQAWLQGNFALVIKGQYELLYIGIPFLILGYVFADKFTIAGMGRDFSKNLGLNHGQVVTIGLIIASMITSVVVVTIGSIPFLGLVIPNVIRLIRGDNLKKSLLDTALVGMNFVLFCDIAGRLIIFPYEIPIGMIVSLIGSVIFLTLILRRRTNAA